MFKGKVISFENGLEVGVGRTVRPPSTYKVSTGDIDLDDKRSISGYLNRNRIRGGATAAYTCEVTWDRISWDELSLLIAAGEEAKFSLTMLDPKAVGGYTTKTMYRDANMSYEMKNIYGDDDAYWSTNMAFVEF